MSPWYFQPFLFWWTLLQAVPNPIAIPYCMEQEATLPRRQYEIDLFRFLAALAVVLYHYTSRAYGPDHLSPVAYPELARATRYGYLGVQLFFIISGYVVLLSAEGKTVRQFFVSRVRRLYPAFWVACTATFIVVRLWGTGPANELGAPLLHAGWSQYAQNLTMLHEFWGQAHLDQAYWSLTVELSFYFLVSLLLAYRLLPHLERVLGLWLIYVAVAPYIPDEGHFFSHLFFPQHAPFFVAGMLFFRLQRPDRRTWARYGLLLLTFVLAVRNARYGAGPHGVEVAGVIGFVGICFLLMGWATFGRFPGSRQAWLTQLGALTYPLYLLHGHIGYVAFHRLSAGVNKYVFLGGLLAGMLLLAYAVANWVEKPLSQLLGRYVNRWLDAADQSVTSTPKLLVHDSPRIDTHKEQAKA